MKKAKPKHTKKMIAACRRRIKQYEEMIEKGVVTQRFESNRTRITIICRAAGLNTQEHVKCIFGICDTIPACYSNTKTLVEMEEHFSLSGINEPLSQDQLKSAKARLAYLKRLFKREGVL